MSDIDRVEFSTSLSEIADVTDSAGLDAAMKDLAARYGLESAAYLGLGLAGYSNETPYLAVTYSHEWVEHYTAQRFVEIDPVIQMGFRRLLPLDWNRLDRSDTRVRDFFGQAGEFGLGKNGLSLPVHGRHGDRGLLSITSDLSAREWTHEKLLYLRDFQVLAMHIHDKVLRLTGHRPTTASLSPRELECLQWIAEGKTAWECAMILGLSHHTVRCYLESARHKLNASSNTHAVSIAHRTGLLFNPL